MCLPLLEALFDALLGVVGLGLISEKKLKGNN